MPALCDAFPANAVSILVRAAALALWLPIAVCSVARADIVPLSSKLTASSAADVDPPTTPLTPDSDLDQTPDGKLRNLSVATRQSDANGPLSETVTASASVTYAGNTRFTVQMNGARSGTDNSVDEPGGTYQSKARFALSFQNLATDTITVDWALLFSRENTGTFTPFTIGLQHLGKFDARGPQVPFSSQGGTASGTEVFDLTGTGVGGFSTLEFDLVLSGSTSDLAPPENWAATFTVRTPPMTITPVPEAGTAGMFLFGLGLLAMLRAPRRGGYRC